MPTSVFSSFYNDSNEELNHISPGFVPNGAMGFPGDDRRPSIASATTVSSSGSKSSLGGKFHKKLQGFFGEDFPGTPGNEGSRHNSETSSMQSSLPAFAPGGGSAARNRNNSLQDSMLRSSRPDSPAESRPRTPGPGPSSEVTPWVFQDYQVSSAVTVKRLPTTMQEKAPSWLTK